MLRYWLLLSTTSAAALQGSGAVAKPGRRTAICTAIGALTTARSVSAAAPSTASVYDGTGVKLSRAAIEGKLSKVPVIALVNDEDAPFLTGRGGVGYFFLDPTEALLELRVLRKTSPEARFKIVSLAEVYFPLVRGEQADLGGELLVRPSRRQVVQANRALQFNMREGAFLPTTLDEAKGQVPVFYSERVAFESGGKTTFPFFLTKEDLDRAFVELGSPSGSSMTKGDASKVGEGIPVGLVRVATLDGLVNQMQSGEIDLTEGVLVGSRDALVAIRSFVQDGMP